MRPGLLPSWQHRRAQHSPVGAQRASNTPAAPGALPKPAQLGFGVLEAGWGTRAAGRRHSPGLERAGCCAKNSTRPSARRPFPAARSRERTQGGFTWRCNQLAASSRDARNGQLGPVHVLARVARLVRRCWAPTDALWGSQVPFTGCKVLQGWLEHPAALCKREGARRGSVLVCRSENGGAGQLKAWAGSAGESVPKEGPARRRLY